MVKLRLLKAEIVKSGIPRPQIAAMLGICQKTLSDRLKYGTFTVEEAYTLTKLLKIKKPADIFFADK